MNFSNFGEFLFYAYANLQMLHYCISNGLEKYNRTCYMIRAKAYKAYKEGRWHIHDLLNENVSKIIQSTQSHMQPCNLSLSSKQLAATAAAYMAFCPDKAQMPTKKPPIRCL